MSAARPRRRRTWPLLLLWCLSTALHAESVPTAQPDPALARGFAPEQLFQGNDRNRRLMAQRTEYEGGKYREAVSNQFDGFGNYRRTVSRGNFVGNDRNRVMEVNYNPGRGSWPAHDMLEPSEPWLLSLRDEEKVPYQEISAKPIKISTACRQAMFGIYPMGDG